MDADTTAADGVDCEGGGAAPEAVQQEALTTVGFCNSHRVKDFVCAKSERVAGFFAKEALVLIPNLYCRVFILPDPKDETGVWGYYTLSASLLYKETMARPDEKKALPYPAPVVRIGFMGTDDRVERGLGRGLIIDAARRVYRNPDIAAWGLVLESEGGPENKKLWDWYQDKGFKPCRKTPNSMYAPLSAFLPELQ